MPAAYNRWAHRKPDNPPPTIATSQTEPAISCHTFQQYVSPSHPLPAPHLD